MLLRCLVSFRHHNDCHEQYIERIFNDLMRYCHPQSLMVYTRYTHRCRLSINSWCSNIDCTSAHRRLTH